MASSVHVLFGIFQILFSLHSATSTPYECYHPNTHFRMQESCRNWDGMPEKGEIGTEEFFAMESFNSY